MRQLDYYSTQKNPKYVKGKTQARLIIICIHNGGSVGKVVMQWQDYLVLVALSSQPRHQNSDIDEEGHLSLPSHQQFLPLLIAEPPDWPDFSSINSAQFIQSIYLSISRRHLNSTFNAINPLLLPTNQQLSPKMASSPASLRSLYRSLLRELPPRPILASPRSPLHSRLRDSFSPSSKAAASQDARAHAAAQAIAYLRSQRMYATLLERYNPGMGMDEEERVRLTARRVGMDLPVEYK